MNQTDTISAAAQVRFFNGRVLDSALTACDAHYKFNNTVKASFRS